jgi:release factor glutamine methyltransferase
MQLKEILDKTIKFFQDKGIETPRLDAELLVAHALKIERIQLYLKFDQPVKEAEMAVAREFVKRRIQGEPVAYIIGEKGFYNSVFKVGPGVLVPRPETEHLVEDAVEWMKKNNSESFAVLDLGCGSGCIGLSILKEEPRAKLFAVDISDKAMEFSKANAEKLGLTARCTFIQANADETEKIMSAVKVQGFEKLNVIVSNPPYIDEKDPAVEKNVKTFEPHEALFASNEGFSKLQGWSKSYLPFLSEPGLMLMEMGYQQGSEMKKHFENLEFDMVTIKKDFSGHDRVIKGEIYG